MDDEIFEAEACSISVHRVVLPNEEVVKDVILSKENTIREEKERILKDANISNPELYEVLSHGPHGSYKVLNDTDVVEDCFKSLQKGAECEVHIRKRGSQGDRKGRSMKPELLNINMK